MLGVEEPEEDERMSWVVADEDRGPDLVIEVLHEGDRDKDLVANVERYAGLGIPEYFVYDRGRQQIRGHRLHSGASRYQPIVPQLGQYHSNVLDLDLAIVRGGLRVFVGQAELPGSADLIGRLSGMIASVEAKAEKALAQAQQAQQALAQAQQALAQIDNAKTQARAEGEAVAAARAVLITLRARGFDVSDVVRERILAQKDPERLERWLEKAAVAASLAEILDEPS